MNINGDYKKITLAGTETEIKFPRNYPIFGVKGENITVALTAGAVSDTRSTADTDGVVMWAHHKSIDAMYLTGTGDAIVWAGDRAEECPFNKKGKGGDSGGGEESQFVMPKFYTSLDCVGNGGRGYGSGNVGLLFNNGGRTVERFATGLGAIVPAGNDDYIHMNWQEDWEIGVAWKLTREQVGDLNTLYATCGLPYHETPSAEIGSDINRSVGMGIGYTNVTPGWGKWQWMYDVDESYTTDPLKWYFGKFSYDSTSNSITISYTDDFVLWSTYTYTLDGTPRNTGYPGYPGTYPICFGAFPDTNANHHNSDYMRIDLGNTYLKQNDQIVWGNYLGNFPD